MTTQTAISPRLSPRFIYAADTFVSGAMGVVLFLTAAPLTQLVGWTLPESFLSTIGLLLLPWAAFNFYVARVARPTRGVVFGNIGGDITWVLGSIALAVEHAPGLTAIGMALLIGQAIAVAGVVVIKLAGVRMML